VHIDGERTVKERPILFSSQMVRALLDGRKTQTRRVCNPQPVKNGAFWELYGAAWSSNTIPVPVMPGHSLAVRGPFGCAGDRLWVRERFSVGAAIEGRCTGNSFVHFVDGGQKYRDGAYYRPENSGGRFDASALKWKPSIHMPRWASRILLEITDVRVQRLQEISEQDAFAEGVFSTGTIGRDFASCVENFAELWDSINPVIASWDSNPWVWAITFRRVDQ
jgi:hypothetical protein